MKAVSFCMFQMCHLFHLRPLCFRFGRHSKQLTPVHSLHVTGDPIDLLSVLLGWDYLLISSVDIMLLECKKVFKEAAFLNTKANPKRTQN